MSQSLEYVFSFRSPYVWIATKHVLPMLDPQTELRWTPFFPLPGFPNFRDMWVPAKARNNLQDILRLASTYGLEIGRPPVNDDDWTTPHAAFYYADQQGKGGAFAEAAIDERWAKGHDLDEPALRRVAERVGLDPQTTWEASRDEKLRAELTELVQRNYDDRDIFGVPMLILGDGTRFWGHDRIEWSIRYGFVKGQAA